ncbi:DUF7537 family lipoprotein [Halobacterium salinarum]|uniref:DUF7537 family lipoprotein n=1 Tax=Halobacterium salinarum TaxID=2242 RepID=UPI002556DE82|nr:hypothetical protein [Halobacterium salinarum]MDL0126632.1 hypothetical protein [Halobacterium salinarum]
MRNFWAEVRVSAMRLKVCISTKVKYGRDWMNQMMKRKFLSAVLLFLLVLSAGCSGLTDTSGADTTANTPNTTSYSSEEPASENTSKLAPGLTEAGVTDAWALAQAHRDSLDNATYTERSHRSVHTNGTLLRNVSTTLKRGHGERYIYEFRTYGTEDAPIPNLTVFRNDSTLVQRTSYDNGTVEYTGPENAATPQTDQYGGVYSILSASNTTVSGTVERNSTTLYHVTSVGAPSESSAYAGVANYEMSALVGPDGLIHEYDISYGTTRDGQEVNIAENLRFTNLGETAVQPPKWVVEVEQ